MTRALIALLALLAVPASAADRAVGIGTFERVRIEGPIAVVFTPGPPRARVSGDARAVERVEVRVNGSTLTVRANGREWGERGDTAPRGPVSVAISAPSLASAYVFAGGRLTASRMRGERLDFAVNGTGEIAVADASADQLFVTVLGVGTVTLAGRAGRARLVSSGAGRIDAAALRTDDLVVSLDGPGETKADARDTARVTNTGLGQVTVTGNAQCVVSTRGRGPVTCGR